MHLSDRAAADKVSVAWLPKNQGSSVQTTIDGSISDCVGSVGSVDLVLGEVPQNITIHFRPLPEGI